MRIMFNALEVFEPVDDFGVPLAHSGTIAYLSQGRVKSPAYQERRRF